MFEPSVPSLGLKACNTVRGVPASGAVKIVPLNEGPPKAVVPYRFPSDAWISAAADHLHEAALELDAAERALALC